MFIRMLFLRPLLRLNFVLTPPPRGRRPLHLGIAQFQRLNRYEKYLKGQARKKHFKICPIWRSMCVDELASNLEIPTDDILELVLEMPNTAHIHDEYQPILNESVFHELSKKLRFKPKYIADPKKKRKESELEEEEQPRSSSSSSSSKPENLRPRAPVIAVMGHVDHGKTTLIDYLRKSSIVAREFGGITQHIGAFSISVKNGERMTFLDTPGHAAFKSMRSRGAKVTDIVILVVDACEGVLEQTKESLRIIREAGVNYVVAINKIDKPNADVDKTIRSLKEVGSSEAEIVPISAKLGTNVESGLLPCLSALSELMELKGDPKGDVEGVIIESQVESGIGKTATVLVQRGTLKKGIYLVSGTSMVKIRRIVDESGGDVKRAGPSDAVKVVGWKDLPAAGAEVLQVPNEKRAIEIIKRKIRESKEDKAVEDIQIISKKRNLERELYSQKRIEALKRGYGRIRVNYLSNPDSADGIPKLPLIIKADVNGSLEAILECLNTYTHHDKVKIQIIDQGVGEITQNDVENASNFNGLIYGFNVPVFQRGDITNEDDVIKRFNVIYRLIDDLKEEINRRAPLCEVEDILGIARLKKEFLVSVNNKKVPVAGCRVLQGKILKKGLIKVLRKGEEIADSLNINSLKHIKEEMSEIGEGKECGVQVDDRNIRFEEGDELVCYVKRLERKPIDWDPGF